MHETARGQELKLTAPVNHQHGGALGRASLCLLFPVQSLTVMGCHCSAFGMINSVSIIIILLNMCATQYH